MRVIILFYWCPNSIPDQQNVHWDWSLIDKSKYGTAIPKEDQIWILASRRVEIKNEKIVKLITKKSLVSYLIHH